MWVSRREKEEKRSKKEGKKTKKKRKTQRKTQRTRGGKEADKQTHGRTSSLFSIVPGLSGTTTSHSYVRGSADEEDAILMWVETKVARDCLLLADWWEAVDRDVDARPGAMIVLARAFRRAAISQ